LVIPPEGRKVQNLFIVDQRISFLSHGNPPEKNVVSVSDRFVVTPDCRDERKSGCSPSCPRF
jgi:hypothetical protein